MKPDRDTVALLLIQQAPRLHAHVEAGATPYTYQITLASEPQGQETASDEIGQEGETSVEFQRYTACVLVRSSDYWRFRLHLTSPHLTMLVCMHHDSCVPMRVLSLGDGHSYSAYTPPDWYSLHTERFTSKTAPVFLGQLLCGVQAAYERLNTLPHIRTRARYLERLHDFSQHKQGRPVQA
jgi:hypothetical protein